LSLPSAGELAKAFGSGKNFKEEEASSGSWSGRGGGFSWDVMKEIEGGRVKSGRSHGREKRRLDARNG